MAKDYLKQYTSKGVAMYQAGGEMAPAPAPAPAPQGGGADIEGMVMQYAETKDPQIAVQIAEALVGMMAESQAGGPAPAPAPAMRNGGRMTNKAPIFRAGGKLKV